MRRETTNLIRFVLEDLLPPALRDSRLFGALYRLVWGKHIDTLRDFRERSALLTPAEYETLYREHPRVHDRTDNSEATIARIAASMVGSSVCDVGCGTGFLLGEIVRRHGAPLERVVGVDFVRPEGLKVESFEFVEAAIETLPFPDGAFDTVICTHVIEHILDYRRAIAELRRITGRRLIIVVPREREGRYTFNPHFNFFPYRHSFLRAMIPLPPSFRCEDIGRDIFYLEDKP